VAVYRYVVRFFCRVVVLYLKTLGGFSYDLRIFLFFLIVIFFSSQIDCHVHTHIHTLARASSKGWRGSDNSDNDNSANNNNISTSTICAARYIPHTTTREMKNNIIYYTQTDVFIYIYIHHIHIYYIHYTLMTTDDELVPNTVCAYRETLWRR